MANRNAHTHTNTETNKATYASLEAQIAAATGASNAALDILSSPTSASLGWSDEDEQESVGEEYGTNRKSDGGSALSNDESVMVEQVASEAEADTSMSSPILDLCSTTTDLEQGQDQEPADAQTNVFVSARDEAGTDFAKIQLDHIPIIDSINNYGKDEVVPVTRPNTTKAASAESSAAARSQSQPPPTTATTKGFADYRKAATEGILSSFSFHQPSPANKINASTSGPPKVNLLVASLQNALSFNSHGTHATGATARVADGNNSKGNIAATPQFDFVNMDLTNTNIDSTCSGSNQSPTTQQATPCANPAKVSDIMEAHAHSPSRSPSKSTAARVSLSATEGSHQLYNQPLQSVTSMASITSTPSYTTYDSKMDNDPDSAGLKWNQRHLRQPLQDMTWQQIMQQNTRANCCAVFLLGIALITLVLLVVAKLTTSHETFFYDDVEDSSIVITDNERLVTIEVLTFALIIVLLLGSLLYCAVAACDSSHLALVQHVKHGDACLANSSGRRKHPSYRPAVYCKSIGTKSYSNSSRKNPVLTPPKCDDHSHSAHSVSERDYSGLANPTDSMMSEAN